MKNNTTISNILQAVFQESEITELSQRNGYEEKARKATVTEIMRYQMAGAIEQCVSYRELEIYGNKHTE